MAKKIAEKTLEILQKQEGQKQAIRNDYFVLGMQQHKLLGITLEIEKEQEKIKVELEEKHGKVNIDLTDGSYKIIEDEKKSDKEKSEWGVVI